MFTVRGKSGKVVGRYHTKAEAEHRVQQLKAGAARLRPFQFTSRSPSRVYGPLRHEEQLVHDYRTENPKSRAQGILKLVKNTSATKQRGCILCGATGPTWSGQYPETKRAREWAAEHVKQHLGAHSPMRGRVHADVSRRLYAKSPAVDSRVLLKKAERIMDGLQSVRIRAAYSNAPPSARVALIKYAEKHLPMMQALAAEVPRSDDPGLAHYFEGYLTRLTRALNP